MTKLHNPKYKDVGWGGFVQLCVLMVCHPNILVLLVLSAYTHLREKGECEKSVYRESNTGAAAENPESTTPIA
jgi:hypothetical protein